MKFITLLLLLFLISCGDAPEQKVQAPIADDKSNKKTDKSHPTMKGHQDAIQRAKDMEKQVLKAAEDQRKAIDDLDG